ncbi:MAG: peptidylprolyl isomerase [candidate division Zixibacteria bacterium]|nr:peptidylprolyl isomerase [candidate division Zixibacteria bacterium]
MGQAQEGDTVKVHYTGKLDNGMVFDSSQDREPLEFKIGAGQVIPGFEKGIIGMEVGQSKTVKLPPEEAYGPQREELIAEVKKADIPENIKPSVGQRLSLRQPDGNTVNVTVSDVNEESITLDANHSLAGKTLIFDIELVEISG